MTLDSEGIIQRTNFAGAALLSAYRSACVGKPFSAYVLRNSVGTFFSHLRETFKTDTVQKCEIELKTPNNQPLCVQLESINMGQAGQPDVCRTALIDVTSLKLAEQNLRDLSEKLSATNEKLASALEAQKAVETDLRETLSKLDYSNKELEQLAYVASHDLKEPLRSISSALSMLEDRYKSKLGDDGDRLINYAVTYAEKMQRLINELMQYSLVGATRSNFEDVDCAEVLASVIDSLKKTVTETSSVITVDPMPTIVGDKVQIGRLFQNLIHNAIKFSDNIPQIRISATRDGNDWRFSVADNGKGIGPENLERAFVLFNRFDSGKSSGLGIGLAMARKIAVQHGGKMWIESEVGKGSTFYFTLPAVVVSENAQSQQTEL